ncbi:MAG: hypothetical protein ACK5MT_14975 [Actinomycetales bacterium]
MLSRLRRHTVSGDEGFSLVLVIGTAVVITALVVTTLVIAYNGLAQSRNRQTGEQSLALAENGVDWAIARVQEQWDDDSGDYTIPGPDAPSDFAAGCSTSSVTYPASAPDGQFGSEQAEKDWAANQLKTMAATGCLRTTEEGQFAAFKPMTPLVNGAFPKWGKVYGMAFMPSYADAKVTRLVKADYVFMPYRPSYAILSGGDLALESSTTVRGVDAASDPLADVHTNGIITQRGAASTVTGEVSSVGVSPGGSLAVESEVPRQNIPRVNAESFYRQAGDDVTVTGDTWHDLCPDGTIRAWSSSGPCTSTTVQATAPAMGWKYDSGDREWTATRTATQGMWYAHHADVVNGTGNATFSNFTVVASAENPDSCTSKRYGNIQWDHYELDAPAYHNLWFMAESDLQTSANFTAGSGVGVTPVVSGMFVAGDQIELLTSSQGATGSVMAGDQCPTPPSAGLITENVVKNPDIYYDPSSDSPFTSIINITLWLDYNKA